MNDAIAIVRTDPSDGTAAPNLTLQNTGGVTLPPAASVGEANHPHQDLGKYLGYGLIALTALSVGGPVLSLVSGGIFPGKGGAFNKAAKALAKHEAGDLVKHGAKSGAKKQLASETVNKVENRAEKAAFNRANRNRSTPERDQRPKSEESKSATGGLEGPSQEVYPETFVTSKNTPPLVPQTRKSPPAPSGPETYYQEAAAYQKALVDMLRRRAAAANNIVPFARAKAPVTT